PLHPRCRRQIQRFDTGGEGVQPSARYLGNVQYREPGAVVLESQSLARPPAREKVIVVFEFGPPRNGEPDEADVPPLAGLRKHEDRRNFAPVRRPRVRLLEESSQQFITKSKSFMKGAAGPLVVAKIDEGAGFTIDRIRPIRVIER